MPTMADAMMPVATTTRIISLIMNALLIFALHFARTEQIVWHEWGKGGYCAADTGREKDKAPCVFGELLERALDAFVRASAAPAPPHACGRTPASRSSGHRCLRSLNARPWASPCCSR
jgi:hypothetical protein